MPSTTSRLAIALGTSLVLGACQDAAAPLGPTAALTSVAAPLGSTTSVAPAAAMAAIGGALVDATEMFLVVIEDAQARTTLSDAIRSLADALNAGDVAATTAALETARQHLAAVPGEATSTELAPVGLALDQVEYLLTATP